MNNLNQIIDDMSKYNQFFPFKRLTQEIGKELIIRENLYSGAFCDYIADLNYGVNWDSNLVIHGLGKIDLQTSPQGNVVDLCCGDGRLTKHLHENGYNTYGIDYSKEQIQRAQMQYPHIEWVSADLLNEEEFLKKSPDLPVSAAVTSSASVNCFHTREELETFLKNTQLVLGKRGCSYLLLPVFADEAIPIFKENFVGKTLCHPFNRKLDNENIMAWLSLLYDDKRESLIQPVLITTNGENSSIQHEFCYSIDRIWTEKDLLDITSNLGWKLKFNLSSNVIGGGADRMPFTLLAFEF